MDLNRLTFLKYHQVLTTFLLEKQNFWCFIHFPWFSYFVKDGTVLIHTVRRGHYVRTLRPPCSPGASLTVHQMALSDVGQIVLYCTQHFIGKSAKDVRLTRIFALIFLITCDNSERENIIIRFISSKCEKYNRIFSPFFVKIGLKSSKVIQIHDVRPLVKGLLH